MRGERMKNLDEFRTKTEAIDYILKESKPGMTRSEAEKILLQKIPKESYYQSRIIRYLKAKYPLAFVWKAAAGPYSYNGIPDVCMILDGRYYGFEVKRPFIGKASAMQLQTIDMIRRAGGMAGIVTTVADVEKLIREGRTV